jgi:hypothetical protein
MQEEHNKRSRGESFKTEFSRQAAVSSRLSPVLKHTHRILNGILYFHLFSPPFARMKKREGHHQLLLSSWTNRRWATFLATKFIQFDQ